MLNKLTSGVYKISIKSNNVYYEDKLVKLDLTTLNCLIKDTKEQLSLVSLSKFVAKGFDVCGEVKLEDDNNKLDLSNSNGDDKLKA